MPKKQWSPEQKLQIVLEALKEERHIGRNIGVHCNPTPKAEVCLLFFLEYPPAKSLYPDH